MSKKYDIQALFNELLDKKYILPSEIETAILLIANNAEKQKGAMTVVATGLIYKHYHPNQDVRYHQSKMKEGYSGRSFDSKNVTPFLNENKFPSMAESGWLTRSFEQALPYDETYPGEIKGKGIKEAFLLIYKSTLCVNIDDMLACFFQGMVKKRDSSIVKLTCPANLTIDTTLKLIKKHISTKYDSSGASRLPNIAIYASYVCAMNASTGRYAGKTIDSLNAHTASDRSTGAIGDIQINDENGRPFEGIEIKDRAVESGMIEAIYRKIQEHETVSRYYLLTTCEDDLKHQDVIEKQIADIRSKHGCDVVVNGVYTTLKYFLRLSDTKEFISLYTELMASDEVIKYEHKSKWNELCLEL